MDSSKSSSPLSRNEADEEMEVGECSDEAEEEEDEDEENEEQNENEEDEEDVVMAENSAPPSSGPALSPTVTYEGLASPLRLHNTTSGKPLSLHRGRGRPRKDASSTANSGKPKKLGLKLKRWKSGMYVPSRDPPTRRDSNDTLNTSIDSCTSDLTTPDGVESSNLDEKNDKTPIDDRITLFQEKWPGKVCSLCNLGERSQLGQGELMKLSIPEGFVIPQKDLSKTTNGFMSPPSDVSDAAPFSQPGDKSPRSSNPAVTFRRQKSWAKSKNAASKNQFEPVEELSIVGYNDEPDPATFFDSGVFYVHQSCALWSEGVTRNADLQLENVGNALVQSASRKCSNCLHYGASVACSFTNCFKFFHFPCAIAAGGFLQTKTLTLVCSLHLDQVPLLSIQMFNALPECIKKLLRNGDPQAFFNQLKKYLLENAFYKFDEFLAASTNKNKSSF